ncbi:uncharacterized protein LOC133912332 [Phragmites australis]|uniref:uncharacterized protein LOC133912332 n=1 Tax=Phragmites australis TaxID=29695 RepID=UPI002D78FF91|nr:uncharacterized protein LOC133912332 [Phragmites australis]
MDDDFDSTCSTPFASAPSSPGRPPAIGGGGGYFFSAPASPIHHLLFSSSSSASAAPGAGRGCAGDAEFEFGGPGGPMISADELFFNGQIRPLTLSPLPDLDPGSDDDDDPAPARGRDLTPRSGSVHRRARSMSPLRSASPRLKLLNALVPAPDLSTGPDAAGAQEAAPPVTASSRSSSSSSTSSSSSASASGRGSRRWVFIKDMLLLHRSKSDPGSGARAAHAHDAPAASPGAKPERAWPFSPSWASKDKVAAKLRSARPPPAAEAASGSGDEARARGQRRGKGRRRSTTVATAHERLYAAPNRAQAEEMRRRTFLPYREGLLGCLGFSSRGYGALHGLTKTLNPVFSR